MVKPRVTLNFWFSLLVTVRARITGIHHTLFSAVLGRRPGAPRMLGKCLPTRLHPHQIVFLEAISKVTVNSL